MRKLIFIVVITCIGLFIVNIEKKVTKIIEIKNLDTTTVCIEEELDSAYKTAIVHTINIYNELDKYNFDFTIKEDCSKGYKYTAVNMGMPEKTFAQAKTTRVNKNEVIGVELRFDNKLETNFEHKILLALHEFGHLVGMRDVYEDIYIGKTVMYGHSALGSEEYLLTLTELDIHLLEEGNYE